MIRNNESWQEKYELLYMYVQEHHQFPDKKKVENRGLLNWWKYNKKCMKAGKLDEEKTEKLQKLSDMRLIHR